MDELKQKKLNILKGKIKEINEQESKEQESIPVRKTKSKKAITPQTDHEEQIALRRKKGLLVQLMYYINKRDFRLNNQK
jgi:hypothetical protein